MVEHDEERSRTIRVILEDLDHATSDDIGIRRRQTQKDAAVGKLLARSEDLVTEILVECEQRSTLAPRPTKDVFIARTRTTLDDPIDVVARIAQAMHERARDILVGEDSHRGGCHAPARDAQGRRHLGGPLRPEAAEKKRRAHPDICL